jgi:D-alanyl-D-alanine dipeptidase
MITAGGLMYSMSGAVDKRKEGKDMIVNSLYGLGILMGSYLILKTINPNLVTLVDFGEYFNEKLEVDGCPMGQATTTTEVFSNGVTSTQVICTSTGALFENTCLYEGATDWGYILQDPQSKATTNEGSRDGSANNAARGGVYKDGAWRGCSPRKIILGPTDDDEIKFIQNSFYNGTENIDTAENNEDGSSKRATVWQYPYFVDLRDQTSLNQFALAGDTLRNTAKYLKWYDPKNPNTKGVSWDVFVTEFNEYLRTKKPITHSVSEAACIVYAFSEKDDKGDAELTPLQYWLSPCTGGMSYQSLTTSETDIPVIENGSESELGQLSSGSCPDESTLEKISFVQCDNADCRLVPKAIEGLKSALTIAQSQGESFVVTSAFRTLQKQTKLFEDAVKKYGSESAARKWVAKPSCKAPHMQGIAVDIRLASMPGGMANSANMSGTDVNTKVMSSENVERVHKLWRIMEQAGWTRYKNEWWHFEYRSAINTSGQSSTSNNNCSSIACAQSGNSCPCENRGVNATTNVCLYNKYENGSGVLSSGCKERTISCTDSSISSKNFSCQKRVVSSGSTCLETTAQTCIEKVVWCTDTIAASDVSCDKRKTQGVNQNTQKLYVCVPSNNIGKPCQERAVSCSEVGYNSNGNILEKVPCSKRQTEYSYICISNPSQTSSCCKSSNGQSCTSF